jgi:transcriptional regulator
MAAHGEDAAAFARNTDESALAGLRKHIVGIRMEIGSIEGKWKLSQNKSAEIQARIADQLSASGDRNARAVADLMRPGPGH